jgi:hypothetical protein
MASQLAVADSLHQSDVAWMRFRPPLVPNPDILSPKKLDRRNISLIITAMVMVPTQTENPRCIVERR